MNCKNIEPLLPLYIGNDLEEEEARLVAAHLPCCTQCTVAADEYAHAGQLLRRYEPPLFSDEVYSGIREQVINKIERDSDARARPGIFSQLFLVLVQPRMRWVTAAVLLAISVTALYLTRRPSRPNDQQVAVRREVSNESASSSSSSSSDKGQIRVATKRRTITRKREASRMVQRAVVISQPSPAPAPLRLELQTSDRNIRIIWLSGPRPDVDGTDGSKGL